MFVNRRELLDVSFLKNTFMNQVFPVSVKQCKTSDFALDVSFKRARLSLCLCVFVCLHLWYWD